MLPTTYFSFKKGNIDRLLTMITHEGLKLPSKSEKGRFEHGGFQPVSLDSHDGRDHGDVDGEDVVGGMVQHGLDACVLVQLERQLWHELVLFPRPVRHRPVPVPNDVLFNPFLTAKQ